MGDAIGVEQIDPAVGEIAARFAHVPFVILPLPGSLEYAVYGDQGDWFLGSADELPLARAMLALRNR